MKTLRKMMGIVSLAMLALFCSSISADAYIIHVSPGGAKPGAIVDGKSWETAYPYRQLQTAAVFVKNNPNECPEQTVHVAMGEYFVDNMRIEDQEHGFAGTGLTLGFQPPEGVTILGAFNPNSNNRIINMGDEDNCYAIQTKLIGELIFNNGTHRFTNGARHPTNVPLPLEYMEFQEDDIGVITHKLPYECTMDGFIVWQVPGSITNREDEAEKIEADLHCAVIREGCTLRNMYFRDGRARFGPGICFVNGGRAENTIIENCIGTARFVHMRGTTAQHTDIFAGYGGGAFFYGGGFLESSTIRNCLVKNGSGQHFVGPARGGAIDMEDRGVGFAQIQNCNIYKCRSESNGGALVGDLECIINNTTFTENSCPDFGGAMVLGIGPTVTNCTFTKNTTGKYGGAICHVIAGRDDRIINCEFNENSAAIGGAVYVEDFNPHYVNCRFNGNVAAYGGGMFTNYTATMDSCTFTGNIATPTNGYPRPETTPPVVEDYTYPRTPNGGAFYSQYNGYAVNSVFQNNEATEGGAVYFFMGGRVENCTLTKNIAQNGGGLANKYGGSILYSNINDNKATINGGGVFGRDGTNIHGSFIANNISEGNGGGIYTLTDTVYITSCVVTNNLATIDGGGIYYEGGGSVTNCTITCNKALNVGGGAFIKNGKLYNSILWKNHASSDFPEYGLFGELAEMNYCAILNGPSDFTRIKLNDQNESGNGPRFYNPNITIGPDANWALYNWNIMDTSICINSGVDTMVPFKEIHPTPGYDDPCITERAYLDSDILRLPRIVAERIDLGAYESQTMRPTIYVTERGSGSKDGFSWRNAMDNIHKATQTVVAFGGGDIRVGFGVHKATPYILTENVNVTGGYNPAELYYSPSEFPTILDGNKSNQILTQDRPFVNRPAQWKGFIFQNGNADNGGAIYLQRGGTVRESIIQKNNGKIGGGVYNNGGTVDSCVIINNNADNLGGGIYQTLAEAVIRNNAISGNTAQNNGGGICVDAGLVIKNIVKGNTGENGGGIIIRQAATVTETEVTGNKARLNGGGIQINHKDALVHDLNVHGNTAEDNGGGIYVSNGEVRTVSIANNKSKRGGGIYFANNTADGFLYNSLIVNNSASVSGGGYYSGENSDINSGLKSPAVVNCTIVNNASATAPGAYIGSGATQNNVFWGNNNNSDTMPQMDYNGPATFPYEKCAVYGVPDDNYLFGLEANNDNKDGPHFKSPSPTAGLNAAWAKYDWRIEKTSICVNNGGQTKLPATIVLDRAQQTRIVAKRLDIGAYEAQDAKVTMYVKPIATGLGDGYSWRNALDNIQNAITNVTASGGGEVCVQSGTYFERLTIRDGVDISGGFVGDGVKRDSYSVIDAQGAGRPLTQHIDTFSKRTIVDGLMLVNGVVSGDESGGGALLYENGVLQNCVVANCQTQRNGGGIAASGAEIYNVRIANNTANSGGGFYGDEGALFVGCMVTNNTAREAGSAKVMDNQTKIINGTFAKNKGNSTGGVVLSDGTSMVNSLVWGNTGSTNVQVTKSGNAHTSYNAVQNSTSDWIELGALNQSLLGPNFINPSLTAGPVEDCFTYNWNLDAVSKCVDNGNNGLLPKQYYTQDLNKNPRVYNKIVDIGATEVYYSTLTLVNAIGGGKYLPGSVVTITAKPPKFSVLFHHWEGDIKYVDFPLAMTAKVTIPNKDISLTAVFVQNPNPDVGGGGVIEVPTSSKPSANSGFTKKPQVYGMANGNKKFNFKVFNWYPGADPIYAIFNSKILLYDLKAFKAWYKEGKSAQEFIKVYQEPEVLTLYYKVPKMEPAESGKTVTIRPPMVDSSSATVPLTHELVDLTKCDPNADGKFGEIAVGKTTTLYGSFFGNKLPKAWLEYRKDGTGPVKKLNLKIEKTPAYKSADTNKPVYTDPYSGASVIHVRGPDKAPKEIPVAGSYTLVIDSGSGLATFSVIFNPQP